jgi:hypothetical protein
MQFPTTSGAAPQDIESAAISQPPTCARAAAEGTSRRPLSAKQAKAWQPQPGPTRWICMTKSEQLRIRARECEALAEAVHDPELRWLYRDMATQYRQMAWQREELGLYRRAVEDRPDGPTRPARLG